MNPGVEQHAPPWDQALPTGRILEKNNWSVTGIGMNGIAMDCCLESWRTGNSVFPTKEKKITGIKAMVGFFFMVLTNASTGSFGSRWKLNKILKYYPQVRFQIPTWVMVYRSGQGVGCARAFWGRKYTRMVLGQGRKYTRMVLARVARVTASSVHAVRGLICTRGQGPRLYTRNGFAVCTPLFLQLCILCAPCVQVVRYRSLAVLPLCILCAPCVQVVRFITMLFGHV